MMPLTFAQQIASVEREIAQRLKVYPRLVARGSMSQQKADRETEAMRCVHGTLKACQQMVEVCEGIRVDANMQDHIAAELDCLLEPLRSHQPTLVWPRLPCVGRSHARWSGLEGRPATRPFLAPTRTNPHPSTPKAVVLVDGDY